MTSVIAIDPVLAVTDVPVIGADLPAEGALADAIQPIPLIGTDISTKFLEF